MRRSRGVAALAVLAMAILTGCGSSTTARDILFVTLDTTRADHLGCYGATDAGTSNLDSLAGEAVLFEQVVAPAPVTLPSHTTIFTGLNPYNHGVRYNIMYVVSEDRTTVAELLRDAGFATGAVVSSFVLSSRFGLDQGFEQYLDLGEVLERKAPDEQPERRADEAVKLAMEWWGEHDDERRFLWVHIWDPHFKYAPPFPFSAEFEERPYTGEIAYADSELGKLFGFLRERGDWDRTLVVVAGDHGEALYEHGERWHANLVYEGAMRVPLIVKPPSRSRPDRVVEPVGLADLAPTVLDYAGLPLPDGLDGISLRQAIDRGRAPIRTLYFESLSTNINFGWSQLTGVRRGRYKYTEGGRPELYDLEVDPGEVQSLVGSEPETVSELARELSALRDRGDGDAAAEAAQAIDEETLEKLASLGYVGGPSAGLVAAGSGIHPPDEVDLLPELLRAQSLVAKQRWDQAADSLDFILRRDPSNRFALHFRAQVFIKTGQLAEALTLAEAQAGFYPDSAEALDLQGEILSMLERPSESARVYEEALLRHPDNPNLRFHRFLALMEAERVEEAEKEAREMDSRQPDHYRTAVAHSMIEAARGRVDESLAALRRSVELGLRNFKPFDGSPLFEQVRRRPEYGELKTGAEEAAGPADSSESER